MPGALVLWGFLLLLDRGVRLQCYVLPLFRGKVSCVDRGHHRCEGSRYRRFEQLWRQLNAVSL